MPDWLVALIVGLGSGVLAGYSTTMLQLRHEREADLRSRMLVAAI